MNTSKFPSSTGEDMEKDPVCGMTVDPKTAAGKSEHRGQTYYFCSPGCKRAFDKEPEKYVSAPSGGQKPHHG
jgi:Cu+-exporting ATPase